MSERHPSAEHLDDEYAGSARYYDLVLEPLLFLLRRGLRRVIDDLAPRSLLDLGCGTGRQLHDLLHRPAALGLDRSPAMLRQAQRQAPGRCVRADATAAPFGDGTFELVYCQLALHEKPRELVHAVLAEARRLLAPGGRLLVVDFARPDRRGPLAWVASRAIHQIERRAGGEHYRSYLEWMQRGGIDGVMEQEGWRLERAERFHWGNVLLGVYEWGS